MIFLIAGATHTGKTAYAQKLLEKYKYPYLSIDHLKMGLIRSGQTMLTPMDDDKLTDYLWPIVREMIKTAIENDQNLIVEGCYIPFDLIDRHYLNMTFEDAYQQSAQKSDYLRDFKTSNLQAQISLIDDIQTIAARSGNRTSLSTENIRGTRNMEIRRKRSEA